LVYLNSPGVEVGDGSVIAAGSVVTKNIPGVVLVAGSPAQVIRALNKPGPSEIGNRVCSLEQALQNGRDETQDDPEQETRLRLLHEYLVSEEWKNLDQTPVARETRWSKLPEARGNVCFMIGSQQYSSVWNIAVTCAYLYLASWLVKLYTVASEGGNFRVFEHRSMNDSTGG
jgi:hypothetical protein